MAHKTKKKHPCEKGKYLEPSCEICNLIQCLRCEPFIESSLFYNAVFVVVGPSSHAFKPKRTKHFKGKSFFFQGEESDLASRFEDC